MNQQLSKYRKRIITFSILDGVSLLIGFNCLLVILFVNHTGIMNQHPVDFMALPFALMWFFAWIGVTIVASLMIVFTSLLIVNICQFNKIKKVIKEN